VKKFLVSCALVLFAFPAFADDQATTNMDPKKKEMMQKWKEASTPGAAHKVLEPMAGNWKYTSKWWEAADAKPEETTGTSNMKMILDGRFLQAEYKGKAMGMPFTGIGMTGYNNISGKYETLFLDNMATAMMHGEGTFDAATKTLSESGEHACPFTESKKAQYRAEWKITDKNNMTYTMYGHGMDGKAPEFKTMEMVFKRRTTLVSSR
jgi:hypothetical protein